MMNNGPNGQPAQNPTVSTQHTPGTTAGANQAQGRAAVARWNRRMAERKKLQGIFQIVHSIIGSVLYGAFTAVCSFGVGYLWNSIFGELIKIALLKYPTALLRSILPAVLAPYSTALLIAFPVSMMLSWIYYGYKTETLGFSNHDRRTLVNLIDKFFYVAPFLSFGFGLMLGVTPLFAFKAAWVFGFTSGLYLTIGKTILAGLYPATFGPQNQEAHGIPGQGLDLTPPTPLQQHLGQSLQPSELPPGLPLQQPPAVLPVPSVEQPLQTTTPATTPSVQSQEPLLTNFDRARSGAGQLQSQVPDPAAQNTQETTLRRSSPAGRPN